MSISKECRPIASSGLMAYLAIDDALEDIHDENYTEAYNACGNAIGHFYIMFTEGKINPEELEKMANPLIEAKRAYEEDNKEQMFNKLISAAEGTREFIFQKVVDCECSKRKDS